MSNPIYRIKERESVDLWKLGRVACRTAKGEVAALHCAKDITIAGDVKLARFERTTIWISQVQVHVALESDTLPLRHSS